MRVRRMAAAARATLVADGYLDAKVSAHRAAGPGVGVCVIAERGPRVTIGRLVFSGRSAVPYAELVKTLEGETAGINHVGGIFDAQLFERDRSLMLLAYYERGRIDTRIDDPKLVRHGARVDVDVAVHESPVYRIGNVRALSLGACTIALAVHRCDA